MYWLAIKRIIFTAVVPFFLELCTHPETALLVHGHETTVEQRVDVGTQQESVIRPVLATQTDRLYMCRLQDRERFLAGYGASAIIGVGRGS